MHASKNITHNGSGDFGMSRLITTILICCMQYIANCLEIIHDEQFDLVEDILGEMITDTFGMLTIVASQPLHRGLRGYCYIVSTQPTIPLGQID